MHFLQFSTVFFLLTVPSNLSFISIYGSSEPATSFFLKSVKNVAKGFIRITYCNSKTKRNGSHLKCCCTPPPLFSVNWHSLFWISHFILFWRRLIPSVPLKTMWLPKTSLPPPLPPPINNNWSVDRFWMIKVYLIYLVKHMAYHISYGSVIFLRIFPSLPPPSPSLVVNWHSMFYTSPFILGWRGQIPPSVPPKNHETPKIPPDKLINYY